MKSLKSYQVDAGESVPMTTRRARSAVALANELALEYGHTKGWTGGVQEVRGLDAALCYCIREGLILQIRRV